MKSNFVVSNERRVWIKGASRLSVIDPYILHKLRVDRLESQYENIELIRARRPDRERFKNDHYFVEKKVDLYTRILVLRLNRLHNRQHIHFFWEKALSLSLLRHVTFCKNIFDSCDRFIDPDIHDCRILDRASYKIPTTFDTHRDYYQNTDLGSEQLFSVYCDLFHNGIFSTIKLQSSVSTLPMKTSWYRRIFRFGFVSKVRRRLLDWMVMRKMPLIGVLESYFSADHIENLLRRSGGRIKKIKLPEVKLTAQDTWYAERKALSSVEHYFDDFDQFCFRTLEHAMPRSFVENFSFLYLRYLNWADKNKSLKWVVDEAWISNERSAWALAMLSERGVRHICNEHNYLSHCFLGNSIKRQVSLCDEFVTLGWQGRESPKIVSGASLFTWKEKPRSKRPKFDVLIIMGCPTSRPPEINAAYGESGGYNAVSYFDLQSRLLSALGDEILSRTVIRAYPKSKAVKFAAWDQKIMLEQYIHKIRRYDDHSLSGRDLARNSRLVVVTYLSTSHLETLIANIPTVIIWNKDSYFLDDRYSNFFDALIEVGICQTDPNEAAEFISGVVNAPESWWSRPEVQAARDKFLSDNIGEPNIMLNHLMDKLPR